MNGYDLHLLALAGALAAGAIGWQIVFGLAGALSLAAGAAVGLGAYAMVLAQTLLEWPIWAAFLLAGLAPAMLLGAAATLIARLESHYFALATLALSEIAVLTAVNWESLTGGANGLLAPPAPAFLATPEARAIAAWSAALLAAVLFYAFRQSVRPERLALLRTSPIAAQSVGIDAKRTRIAAMATGAAAGGFGGGAHALAVGLASPDLLTFKTMAAILAIVIIGGRRSPFAAAALALAVTWTPEALRFLEQTYLVAYGVLLLAAVLFLPNGLAALFEPLGDRFSKWLRWNVSRETINSSRPAKTCRGEPLQISGVSRRFGGLVALSDVSFTLRPGEIVGLIGPNGAGKSTLLNIISGLDHADAGAVSPDDRRIQGRTFQTPALVPELTVLGNVLAADASPAAARNALSETDLADLADRRIHELPQGERRFVELARAKASAPQILLLDEPAAGLTPAERDRLADCLRRSADGGAIVLVVEHDVPFLAGLAERLICLAEGKVIADGAPGDVTRDSAVVASYLGRAMP